MRCASSPKPQHARADVATAEWCKRVVAGKTANSGAISDARSFVGSRIAATRCGRTEVHQ
jgi:hypothetical protein